MYALRYKLAMRSLLPLENGTAEARLAQRAPLPQYVVTTTEDSLAKEALLPLDIWLVISESFLTRATLCSLCLVSKGLNRIFTPVLYHTVASLSGYSRWERKLKKMSKLDSETHLQFTRHLEIGYSRLAPIVDPAVLRSLFEKMARLRSCKVWCRPTQARYFFLPEVTDLAMTYDAEALEQMPSLPPFKNLYSLDLRNIGGNLSMLWHDVAEVLIGSPNLKLLGLELNEDCRSHHQDFLVGLVEHFKYLREANKTPKTRLKIQELILGRGIAAFPYGAVISGHLSELTDLSMLRSLKILNQRSPPMFNRPRVLLNHNLFLQATKLRSLSVYVIGRDIVALINALSCYGFLQEIQIRSITDYNNPNVDWYRPIDLGGGWKKILLGGDMWDVCPEHVYNDFFKTFFPQSCDIQELGLPYIRWDLVESQLSSFPNLRVLMCGYYIFSSEIPGDQISKPVFAKMVFKAHRKASRDQGLTSRLRYVGIGMSVYTLAYTLLSVSGNERTLQSIDQVTSSHPLDEHNDDFELLELEFEEASSFDFIKSLQKITYR